MRIIKYHKVLLFNTKKILDYVNCSLIPYVQYSACKYKEKRNESKKKLFPSRFFDIPAEC